MYGYQQTMFVGEIAEGINGIRGDGDTRIEREINMLRERAMLDRTLENFSTDEVLELILANHMSKRGKYSPAQVAANLVYTFGTLPAVLSARPEQLRNVEGMNDKLAAILGQQLGIIRAYTRAAEARKDRIGNSRDAESYCASLLRGERVERFYVVALNAQCKRLGNRCISTGSLSEVSAYPRLVVEAALNLNAHSVLLTHNHPGGTCAPSQEDIQSTLQLQKLLTGLGILVLDHIIVTDSGTYSMIEHGDIDYRVRNR